MGFEGIDVSERRVPHTGRRVPVMQQFADIVSAGAQDVEPAPRNRAQLVVMRAHPRLNLRIAPNRTRKLHKPRFPDTRVATRRSIAPNRHHSFTLIKHLSTTILFSP